MKASNRAEVTSEGKSRYIGEVAYVGVGRWRRRHEGYSPLPIQLQHDCRADVVAFIDCGAVTLSQREASLRRKHQR